MSIHILNMDPFLFWFKNISILIMLLLLYQFIPDRIYIAKKYSYSILIGILFVFSSLLATVIGWTSTSQTALGMNAILTPIAGFVGGPISAIIITSTLIAYEQMFGSMGINNPEMLPLVVTATIGIIFYYIKEKNLLKIPTLWLLLLFSITTSITVIFINSSIVSPFTIPDWFFLSSIYQMLFTIIAGLFILGCIIIYIDKNKESKYELIVYKEHLEGLVQDRLNDLENINALHKSTIESTTDGIVVTDFDGNIKNYNHAAKEILQIRDDLKDASRINILAILGFNVLNLEPSEIQDAISNSTNQLISTHLPFRSGKIYELHISPHILKGESVGSVLNFRDITARTFAEDSLMAANKKMLLLSDITRHDILNMLTALNLYHDMALSSVTDPEVIDYLKNADRISQTIQMQAEFTRDYQILGLNKPIWINLKECYLKSIQSFLHEKIEFLYSGPDVEIFSDPLLERVFHNLIDNSIRHGDHVSKIVLTVIDGNDNLLIRYEDNGCGVEDKEKERIFEKGFGKHTGLGMFLIHEILSITGIDILETGIYGKGVRFDITVPVGKFKIVSGDNPLESLSN